MAKEDLSAFYDTAYFACCGAEGLIPQKREADWPTVARIAAHQQATALVFSALLKDRCGCPDDIFSALKSLAMNVMIRNDIKHEKINELLKDSHQQGIRLSITKGMSIAECYADPLTRQSNDVDLIADPGDIKKAYAFLKQRMRVLRHSRSNGHYAILADNELGAVELHSELETKAQGNIWFPGAQLLYQKPCFTVDRDLFCLDHTQQFNFICYHALHHFVYGGISIQMCIDIEMYYRKHSSEIDLQAIDREFERIGCKGFISCIGGLLQRAGMQTEIPYYSDDEGAIDDLAEDLLLGCGFKRPDDEAYQVISQTRKRRVKAKHRAVYAVWYNITQYSAGIRMILFPHRETIKNTYPSRGFWAAYFSYVSMNLKRYVISKPGKNHDQEVMRREALLKELGLL